MGPGERLIRLPGGQEIVAEVMVHPDDMARGMMYRDAIEPERGMLFIHPSTGNYPYWMHNVKIPLDIIWLDAGRRVVEISANTPPCADKPANECPSYGGRQRSSYVLELGGGEANRLGIAEGVALEF